MNLLLLLVNVDEAQRFRFFEASKPPLPLQHPAAEYTIDVMRIAESNSELKAAIASLKLDHFAAY
jgi:hypothetical protein